MNFADKYNRIIDIIEENIDKDHMHILDQMKTEICIDERSLCEIFKFITGYVFRDYIPRRRAEYIFNYKKENKCKWEDASYRFGYDDHRSFQRNFKAYTGKTLSEAMNDDSDIAFMPPLYLTNILEDKNMDQIVKIPNDNTDDSVLLDIKHYESFEEIMKYQAAYGFSNQEIVELYNKSCKVGISLKDVCECVWMDKEEGLETHEENLHKAAIVADKAEIGIVNAYSYISIGYSVYKLVELIKLEKATGTHVYKLEEYLAKGASIEQLKKIHVYCKEKSFEFGDYLESILLYKPDAFSKLDEIDKKLENDIEDILYLTKQFDIYVPEAVYIKETINKNETVEFKTINKDYFKLLFEFHMDCVDKFTYDEYKKLKRAIAETDSDIYSLGDVYVDRFSKNISWRDAIELNDVDKMNEKRDDKETKLNVYRHIIEIEDYLDCREASRLEDYLDYEDDLTDNDV